MKRKQQCEQEYTAFYQRAADFSTSLKKFPNRNYHVSHSTYTNSFHYIPTREFHTEDLYTLIHNFLGKTFGTSSKSQITPFTNIYKLQGLYNEDSSTSADNIKRLDARPKKDLLSKF
jgi:hypothetical protein